MTEAEWLACEDVEAMLTYLIGEAASSFLWRRRLANKEQHKGSDRQFRLLAIACYRAVWDHLTTTGQRLLTTAEEQAETESGHVKAARLREELHEHPVELGRWAISDQGAFAAWMGHEQTTDFILRFYQDKAKSIEEWRQIVASEMANHRAVVVDIFGNPFRPVVADPSWLTSDVLALAEGIYQERAFDRMPILADALQDAGCDNDDILNHCRSDGPHCRGCWVVDMILGKV